MKENLVNNSQIAIISDIHGNYEALKAVIEDIEEKNIKQIICLGDIIGKGVNSKRCLDLVRKKCNIVVKGNVDERFSSDAEEFKNNPLEYKRIKFYQKGLTEDDIEYLRTLPTVVEFYMSGNLIRIFHASPSNEYETIDTYEKDFTKKYDLFKPVKGTCDKIADIVIFGHLHYQLMEKIYGKTMVNAGSVGASGCTILKEGYNSNIEISNAHYLILSGVNNTQENRNISFSFESVTYNKEKELEISEKEGNIELGYRRLLEEGYYLGLQDIIDRIERNGYKIL